MYDIGILTTVVFVREVLTVHLDITSLLGFQASPTVLTLKVLGATACQGK